MPDAAYLRRWRAAHPEYRAREALRSRARKATSAYRAWRRTHERRQSRALPPLPPLPPLHQGHPILATARLIAGPAGPLWDDLVGEAALALVAGEDPAAAVTAFRRREQAWAFHTAPLMAWAA